MPQEWEIWREFSSCHLDLLLGLSESFGSLIQERFILNSYAAYETCLAWCMPRCFKKASEEAFLSGCACFGTPCQFKRKKIMAWFSIFASRLCSFCLFGYFYFCYQIFVACKTILFLWALPYFLNTWDNENCLLVLWICVSVQIYLL